MVDGPDGNFASGWAEFGGKARFGLPLTASWTAGGGRQVFEGGVLATAAGRPDVVAEPVVLALAQRAPDAYLKAHLPRVDPGAAARATASTGQQAALLTDPDITAFYLGSASAADPDVRAEAQRRFGRALGPAETMPDGQVRQAFESVILEHPVGRQDVSFAPVGSLAIAAGWSARRPGHAHPSLHTRSPPTRVRSSRARSGRSCPRSPSRSACCSSRSARVPPRRRWPLSCARGCHIHHDEPDTAGRRRRSGHARPLPRHRAAHVRVGPAARRPLPRPRRHPRPDAGRPARRRRAGHPSVGSPGGPPRARRLGGGAATLAGTADVRPAARAPGSLPPRDAPVAPRRPHRGLRARLHLREGPPLLPGRPALPGPVPRGDTAVPVPHHGDRHRLPGDPAGSARRLPRRARGQRSDPARRRRAVPHARDPEAAPELAALRPARRRPPPAQEPGHARARVRPGGARGAAGAPGPGRRRRPTLSRSPVRAGPCARDRRSRGRPPRHRRGSTAGALPRCLRLRLPLAGGRLRPPRPRGHGGRSPRGDQRRSGGRGSRGRCVARRSERRSAGVGCRAGPGAHRRAGDGRPRPAGQAGGGREHLGPRRRPHLALLESVCGRDGARRSS